MQLLSMLKNVTSILERMWKKKKKQFTACYLTKFVRTHFFS